MYDKLVNQKLAVCIGIKAVELSYTNQGTSVCDKNLHQSERDRSRLSWTVIV